MLATLNGKMIPFPYWELISEEPCLITSVFTDEVRQHFIMYLRWWETRADWLLGPITAHRLYLSHGRVEAVPLPDGRWEYVCRLETKEPIPDTQAMRRERQEQEWNRQYGEWMRR